MFLFFDTETTGLPKYYNAPLEALDNWPRLVQIAWAHFDENGKKLSGENHIIKPQGFVIPQPAANVHGITTELALKKGKALKPVLKKFAAATREAQIIVAHNISFDEMIIGAELLRTKVEHELFDTVRVCTMKEATDYCQIPGNYGYKWPRLSELHIKLFNKNFKNAHDALADVEACAKCFFKMLDLGIIQY